MLSDSCSTKPSYYCDLCFHGDKKSELDYTHQQRRKHINSHEERSTITKMHNVKADYFRCNLTIFCIVFSSSVVILMRWVSSVAALKLRCLLRLGGVHTHTSTDYKGRLYTLLFLEEMKLWYWSREKMIIWIWIVFCCPCAYSISSFSATSPPWLHASFPSLSISTSLTCRKSSLFLFPGVSLLLSLTPFAFSLFSAPAANNLHFPIIVTVTVCQLPLFHPSFFSHLSFRLQWILSYYTPLCLKAYLFS